MNGTYKYSYKHVGYLELTPYTLRVTVVAERGERYQVKYLGFHANGAPVGSLHWVRKDKVKLDNETPVQVKAAPVRDDIRLPYKDND